MFQIISGLLQMLSAGARQCLAPNVLFLFCLAMEMIIKEEKFPSRNILGSKESITIQRTFEKLFFVSFFFFYSLEVFVGENVSIFHQIFYLSKPPGVLDSSVFGNAILCDVRADGKLHGVSPQKLQRDLGCVREQLSLFRVIIRISKLM